MKNFSIIIQIIAITILTVFGDSFLNKAWKHKNNFINLDFLVGIIIYASTAFLWVLVYKSAKFSISGVIYSVFSILMFVLIGIFMFHEKISKTEILGISMAIGSLFLLHKYL